MATSVQQQLDVGSHLTKAGTGRSLLGAVSQGSTQQQNDNRHFLLLDKFLAKQSLVQVCIGPVACGTSHSPDGVVPQKASCIGGYQAWIGCIMQCNTCSKQHARDL